MPDARLQKTRDSYRPTIREIHDRVVNGQSVTYEQAGEFIRAYRKPSFLLFEAPEADVHVYDAMNDWGV